MTTDDLRPSVLEANLAIVRAGLVVLSFGNASAIDRAAGLMLIKPSGVAYDTLRTEDMVPVALADGRVLGGSRRPSSDAPTHLVLYRAFPEIGGIVHTHSPSAVAWAQAGLPIPCFGTTHADHFAGAVPVTRPLTPSEIEAAYEEATGEVILETLAAGGMGDASPLQVPAVLVGSHGPFTWGADVAEAAVNAIALEAVAAMAISTLAINPDARPVSDALLRKHYLRKHGPDAYYGQPRG